MSQETNSENSQENQGALPQNSARPSEQEPLHTSGHQSGPSSGYRSGTPQPLSAVELGARLFAWRDYTPVPLIALLLIFAAPGVRSATLGMFFVFLGELIRLYGVAFIGSVSRTRNTQSLGQQLITAGPFSLVRNPLYVGNFFLASGLAVFSGVTWIVVVTVIAFAVQYHCIVRYEETLLAARFGKAYQEYMEKVPAWVPSHLPSIDELEWPDTFSPALRSERRTLGAIVAIIGLLLIIAV